MSVRRLALMIIFYPLIKKMSHVTDGIVKRKAHRRKSTPVKGLFQTIFNGDDGIRLKI